MNKIFIITFIAILCMSFFVAAEENLETLLLEGTEEFSGEERIDAQKEVLANNPDLITKEIEAFTTSLPGILKTVVGNVRVNIYFENDYVMGIVLEDTKVVEIQNEEIANPTFEVYVSDKVFEKINTGEEPNIKTTLKDKDITYKGLGFKGKMKSAILTAALKVSGM
ncbi:hypothetical protein J4424_04505 [Candidatus Woesearchaeota archaeon]|nr:hypothetical protein [Candidatus Woesearchaeota archaeon]HIJ04732.1 hypothetical protein [Nanoarchaeota archaeon]